MTFTIILYVFHHIGAENNVSGSGAGNGGRNGGRNGGSNGRRNGGSNREDSKGGNILIITIP